LASRGLPCARSPARRSSPAHRHMRALLASPPRLSQRVIDASTGRRRPGAGQPSARGHRQSLARLANLRPHRLSAVCRAPGLGAAQLASASAHTCLAGIAAAPVAARDRRIDGPSSARCGATLGARAPAVPCSPCEPSSASASRGLPCARSPARRSSLAHRHMRALLASPPRLSQRVIDASTGRRRPGAGQPSARGHRQSLARLANLRSHRLSAVCRAPDHRRGAARQRIGTYVPRWHRRRACRSA
jgi:hypothetical protein